jgi:ABC-type polar amino acid transport system ATPase subunit
LTYPQRPKSFDFDINDGAAITIPAIDPVPIRRRLGLVFGAYNLFPHRSVIDNVILGAVKAQGMDAAEAKAAGVRMLERFGLGARAGDYPDRLSGGQQQRVADCSGADDQSPSAAPRRGHERARP